MKKQIVAVFLIIKNTITQVAQIFLNWTTNKTALLPKVTLYFSLSCILEIERYWHWQLVQWKKNNTNQTICSYLLQNKSCQRTVGKAEVWARYSPYRAKMSPKMTKRFLHFQKWEFLTSLLQLE